MTDPDNHYGPPRWLEPVVGVMAKSRRGLEAFIFSKPVSSIRWILGRVVMLWCCTLLLPFLLIRWIFEIIFAERSDNEPKTIQGTELTTYAEALAEAKRLYPDDDATADADTTRPR